jgi:hypothetical protein
MSANAAKKKKNHPHQKNGKLLEKNEGEIDE